MKFQARPNESFTGLDFGSEYNVRRFKDALKQHGRWVIQPLVPDSKRQRAFYFGAVLPLWAYLNGQEYRDREVIDELHEVAKQEFNGKIVQYMGKHYKVGKSSRGELNKGFLERVIDFLVEQYGVDQMTMLNPNDYQYFKDVVYPKSKFDDYLTYLDSMGIIKR